MTRGRIPDPAAIKVAKGNPGRRPIAEVLDDDDENSAVVEPSIGAARPPRWFELFPEVGTELAIELSALAQDIWDRLCADLVRMNLLKSTDENAFTRYCWYMAEWVHCTRVLAREGFYYITSSEHVGDLKRPHPAARHRKDVERSLKEAEETMGLTPAARQRLFQALSRQQPALPPGQGVEAGASAPAAGRASPLGILGTLN